jgi:hypothetical protein
MDRPVQGFPACYDDQRLVQLACQIPQPRVGELHPSRICRCRHEGLIAIYDDDGFLIAAGRPEVLGEQVGHGVAKFPVRQGVKCLQGGIMAYPQTAADVGRSPLQELDEPQRGSKYRQAGNMIENVGQDPAVLNKRQLVLAQPQVRMQALPQHRVGNVETVKVCAL